EDIAGFTHDPLGYALYAFPWGEEGTELAHATGPRQWQADAFREIRDHLQNPEARYQPLMLARASGHGIGKSAFISMLINWGMSTCEDCKVVVTANTDNQLRTKTWPEIIKWSNLAITKDW
ncbi:terminase, partial [Escherichia coli]